jgi:tripartite ATP-independent transporter DctP family solute receptor
MDRRSVVKLGLAGLAMGAVRMPAAFGQAKLVLKATDVHPLGYPTVEAVVRMGKKLEAATNGRIGIQMYPSMQLGGEKEMIEQAQVGALQIARISVGPMGPLVAELNVFNLPFVFRDATHAEKVMDGPIGDEMLKKLSDHPTAGLIGLCWMNGGTRNVYNSKHPIKTVEDLKGLKIRMMGNPVFVDTMNSLGGNGVAMGFDQLVNAMQTGVVDGAENNEPSYESGPLRQVLLAHRPSDHPRAPRLLEEVLGRPVQGRSGAGHEVRQGSAAGAAHALVRARKGLHRYPEESRRRDQRGRGQEAVPGRRQAGVGQVRRPARGTDRAHPRREVRLAVI